MARISDRARLLVRANPSAAAESLRAERAIEHSCPAPAKACVAEAINLIDKAIGGETF